MRKRSMAAIGLSTFMVLASVTQAEPPPEIAPTPGWERWLDNEYYKITFNVRARIELANQEGLDSSQAYTVRTKLGIGTKPWRGFSAYAEIENSFAIAGNQYFDAVETPTGQTAIADPTGTDLNQAYLRYENAGFFGLRATAGRQRIVLDDQRFVGNVGWRQNEQTFDAFWGTTSLGVDDLSVQYGYVWDVRRIFGDEGPSEKRDFDSDSHLVRLAWERWDSAKLTFFAYLLDFDNSPGDSSNSYGLRLTGSRPIGSGLLHIGYALSYAYQTDAGPNPVDYGASYAAADLSVGHAHWGRIGVGYELLESDDGDARFVTPLATAHKFNGFADVFLDNGGTDGLRDLYLYIAPELPWKLKGKLVYHRFWSDEGSRHLGDEVDFVLSRPLTKHLTLLTKGAYFEGSSRGPADRWRFWLELTFTY